MYDTKEKRKLKYRFSDLEAIIFGLKTPLEAKLEIIKIIEAKCQENNRRDFEFYQAVYASHSGKMELQKLDFKKLVN